ncbi:MAG: hypothetical protein HYY59_04890 [Candidatus Omnitrophica bacterium]|nr:hypothetical protein [Candidatus Omnitrophota bacterium]
MSQGSEVISEMPYGLRELREDRPSLISPHLIRCHVKDCGEVVTLPKGRHWKRWPDNRCSAHRIFVHKGTYRFDDAAMGWQRNFLKTVRDTEQLESMRSNKTKFEQRWAHENSEDALTWNVFRTFEKVRKLSPLVSVLTGGRVQMEGPIELIPWGYHNSGSWDPLKKARACFEPHKGVPTEPDVVLLGGSGVVFVEAKFGSPNKRKEPDIASYEKDGFYKHHLTAARLALVPYSQLVRHFLFAAYVADQLGLPQFMLVNLVRRNSQQEARNTSQNFGQDHLKNPARFRQATWEEIYDAFLRSDDLAREFELLKRYFENKTWNLQPAFDLD